MLMGRPLAGCVNRFVTAPDGLRLHMREYGSPLDPGIAVVCLPGLARCCSDFNPLAVALTAGAAGGTRRRVFALDYRGRGASDHDPNWRNFELGVEQADIAAMLMAAEISDAIFIGTSRGGLHIMAMAAFRPNLLRGAVLNDVGPVVEPLGLLRIRRVLSNIQPPRGLEDGIDLLKRLMGNQFTALSEEEWKMHALATFQKADGSFGLKYSPMLVKALESIDLEAPLPTLWPLYDTLQKIPLLIIRGANSDVLSPETFAEMARHHETCETLVVQGQGHAPLLYDGPSIEKIAGFIAKIEADADQTERRDVSHQMAVAP
ncbi:MAG: alpha/beta fold hydrolase [Beijerinckiaceae bacterium]